MMRTFLFATALVAVLAIGYGVAPAPDRASGAPGKNLKVYPPDTDLTIIKKDMKAISKALGVQCDYCHDLDAMDADSKKKDEAREMMKLTAAANARLKKDGFDGEVKCATCHAGQKKPKK